MNGLSLLAIRWVDIMVESRDFLGCPADEFNAAVAGTVYWVLFDLCSRMSLDEIASAVDIPVEDLRSMLSKSRPVGYMNYEKLCKLHNDRCTLI